MQFEDRKPSRLLVEMRNKAGKKISQEVLKSLFLQRLPTHVQQILAIANDKLERLAEMVDGIMAAATDAISIQAVSWKEASMQATLMEISSRLSRLEERSRSRSRESGEPPVTLHCDVSLGRIRSFVPENFRRGIFRYLHALSHLGIRALVKMISERYAWPSMRADVRLWSRTCLQCQQAKVSQHTRSKHEQHGRRIWKRQLQRGYMALPLDFQGNFLSPTMDIPDPFTFVGKLREVMQRLLPPKPQLHGSQTVFVSKDLDSCTHVILRTDALRKSLQPPYEGPFRVHHRTEKSSKIDKHGKGLTVNVNRVKPAYVLHDCDNTRHPASESPAQQRCQRGLPDQRLSPAPDGVFGSIVGTPKISLVVVGLL
ncbi:hypothetical protein HNY73_003576 [Argiope bruennichi]|uniref:Integrase zinc-binding domain-containing protein n=1 Tax=Argiope bruennichi TaxID=94029 RepID=A0A8T0FR16_ARGBR|nr:hypothetical protein HNY73_003576 [Argiope bruennichi]